MGSCCLHGLSLLGNPRDAMVRWWGGATQWHAPPAILGTLSTTLFRHRPGSGPPTHLAATSRARQSSKRGAIFCVVLSTFFAFSCYARAAVANWEIASSRGLRDLRDPTKGAAAPPPMDAPPSTRHLTNYPTTRHPSCRRGPDRGGCRARLAVQRWCARLPPPMPRREPVMQPDTCPA